MEFSGDSDLIQINKNILVSRFFERFSKARRKQTSDVILKLADLKIQKYDLFCEISATIFFAKLLT